MKKVVLILIISFYVSSSYGQRDSVIKYWDVIKVDSVSKDELFRRGRQWFNSTFKSSKDVLQIQDKETGELSGKASFLSYFIFRYMGEHKSDIRVLFNVSIYVKDGRYKYELSNFVPTNDGSANYEYEMLTSNTDYPGKMPMLNQKRLNEMWLSMKAQIDKEVSNLIVSIKTNMASGNNNDF